MNDYGSRLREVREKAGLTQPEMAERLGIKRAQISAAETGKSYFSHDVLKKLSQEFSVSLDWLFFDNETRYVDNKGRALPMNGDIVLVPILDQKVSAGPGQELMDTAKIVGKLPFLKRMLRGHEPESARALEVRGDSMTGIQMFDGDIVVFRPGDVAGDGIYVIRIHDVLLVKRIIFDHISGKLSIMSENPRYPDKVESSDSQAVTVIGKVYGWLHAHPY